MQAPLIAFKAAVSAEGDAHFSTAGMGMCLKKSCRRAACYQGFNIQDAELWSVLQKGREGAYIEHGSAARAALHNFVPDTAHCAARIDAAVVRHCANRKRLV